MTRSSADADCGEEPTLSPPSSISFEYDEKAPHPVVHFPDNQRLVFDAPHFN
jgi:hypothetical protein